MHRTHRALTLVLPTAFLPLVFLAAHAQSMPPGQVTHRMSTRPPQPVPPTAPRETSKMLTDLNAPPAKTPIDAAQADSLKVEDRNNLTSALGSANQAFWAQIVDLDNDPSADPVVSMYLRTLSDQFKDSATQGQAMLNIDTDIKFLEAGTSTSCAPSDPKAASANGAQKPNGCGAIAQLQKLRSTLDSYRCSYSVAATTSVTQNSETSQTVDTPQYSYVYKHWWLPMNGLGCSENKAQHLVPIQNFFSVTGTTEVASEAKYIYNAKLSTSQVSAQLITATFSPGFLPPFQAVLAGTATSGTASNSSSASTAATTSAALRRRAKSTTATTASGASTDSTATALAKIQAGGDFNVSFPTPLLYHAGDKGSLSGNFTPNLGFTLNGLSGQNTITEATEYALNLPFEFYAQTYSLESGTSGLPAATFFVNFRPSVEVISSTLAKSISPNTSPVFFLGQAAAGIEFAQSLRISFQYLYSQKNIFNPASASGSSSGATQNPNGFHLAVSFSPQGAKKAASN